MKIFKIAKDSNFRKDIRDLFDKYGLNARLITDEGQSDDWAIKTATKIIGSNEISLNDESILSIQDQIGNFRLVVSGKVREYEDNLIKISQQMLENKPETLIKIK